jgi:hypothetical protein
VEFIPGKKLTLTILSVTTLKPILKGTGTLATVRVKTARRKTAQGGNQDVHLAQ